MKSILKHNNVKKSLKRFLCQPLATILKKKGMKNYYLITLIFLTTISHAQIVNIPDAMFKNVLVNSMVVDLDCDGVGDVDVDTNDDGEIQVSEAESVICILIPGAGIFSIEGIHSFVNLEKFRTFANQLGSLDFSQNLNLTSINCNNNALTSLIIPEQLDLQYLICYNNQLTSIDVSHFPNLIRLSCGQNPIQSVDVTQNPLLEHLGVGGSQLTNLDISQNPNLKKLYFWQNEISNIDLSQNLYLEEIQSDENLLTSIDVSLSTNLIEFSCSNNQISQLDISQNPNLTLLFCFNNLLTSLNAKNGNNTLLEYLGTYDNPDLTCIQVDDIDFANDQNCNDDYWCKDPWADYSEICILETEDINQVTFTLYPNPTQDILNIESQEPIDSVQIYSLNGVLVKEGNNTSLRVSELPSGVYFVRILINNKTLTKKFIKS